MPTLNHSGQAHLAHTKKHAGLCCETAVSAKKRKVILQRLVFPSACNYIDDSSAIKMISAATGRSSSLGDIMATLPQPPEGESESFRIVFDKETDGRWLAEVPELPGVMVYGKTKAEAEVAVTALALRVIADRTEQQKKSPKSIRFL